MKIIITLLTIASISFSSFSQGNLQWNQVINLDFTTSTGAFGWVNSGTFTVPAGKTWKIVSAGVNNTTELTLYTTGLKIGKHIAFAYSNSNQSLSIETCPIWYGTGTYNVFIYDPNSSSTFEGALSIIEFNIVP